MRQSVLNKYSQYIWNDPVSNMDNSLGLAWFPNGTQRETQNDSTIEEYFTVLE